jgi:hypothetical protein
MTDDAPDPAPPLAVLAALPGPALADPGGGRARPELAGFAALKDVKAALLAPDGREMASPVAVTDLQAKRVKAECMSGA